MLELRKIELFSYISCTSSPIHRVFLFVWIEFHSAPQIHSCFQTKIFITSGKKLTPEFYGNGIFIWYCTEFLFIFGWMSVK